MSPTLSRLISLSLQALPRYEAGATAGPLGLLDERGWLVGRQGWPATTDVPITMRLAGPPEPCDWFQSA